MKKSPALVIWSVIVLISLGLTTIWSTVPNLFLSQLTFVALGIVCLIIFSKIELSLAFSLSLPLYVCSLLFLVSTLIIGEVTRGSTRWIEIGPIRLQASELVKPLLAIFFANFLSRHSMISLRNYFSYLVLLLLPVVLILVQPDLGSSLILLFMGLLMLFVSDVRPSTLIVSFLLGLLFIIPAFGHLKFYQQQRITSFINPYSDPAGGGYNIIQSVIAVGSGQIMGLGVKQGTQSHLKFLPERHTDFIFASFAEEFGFIGSLILLSSYLLMFSFWFGLSKNIGKKEHYYLLCAVIGVITFQFLVNIGMNLGIMPVTGITLPLVSYGGSSLLTLMILIGLSLNLNTHHSILRVDRV